MRNIQQGRGRGASRLNLGTAYAPSKASDPAVVRGVLQMLTDGASGKDTAALCGVSERTVSRIRAREAKQGAETVPRPRGKRRKYERPYTREQRAGKKGLVR
jgi:transposase